MEKRWRSVIGEERREGVARKRRGGVVQKRRREVLALCCTRDGS